MKVLQKLALVVSVMAATIAPALATPAPLPDSGTYFIVNASSEEALEPVQPSTGQNVYLHEFTKSGVQKWTITRKIDPKTKKPTNRYTIKLAGDNQGVNLQPHPVAEMAAIVSLDVSVFVLEPGEEGFQVKSVTRNGDALYIYPSPPSPTETRFGPSDGSTKFRWKFIPAN